MLAPLRSSTTLVYRKCRRPAWNIRPPNNSMEPTRPAGGYVWRDTSLGWPGGSSRGRSADVLPPPRSGSSPQTNRGRGQSPGEISTYQGQMAAAAAGPDQVRGRTYLHHKESQPRTFLQGRKAPSPGSGIAAAPASSHSHKCWHPPNNSMEPTWPAQCLVSARY